MQSTHSDSFSSSSSDCSSRAPSRPGKVFRPSFRKGYNMDLVPTIEIKCAPNESPSSPVNIASKLFTPKKMPWAQSSSQLNRILQKRGSCRRSSKMSNKPPRPKGNVKNNAFVDPLSLPQAHSPIRFGKFLVRVFDGNMHETQIQRLAHTRSKKRGSTLSRLSRQSWRSRNSFLNVESSGEYSSTHSNPLSSPKHGQSSLASFSIKSNDSSPKSLLHQVGSHSKAKSMSLSKSILKRLDTTQTIRSQVIRAQGRIPNAIKENSIASASTAPSLKRLGLTQTSNFAKSKFKSSSFRPPSQRSFLPTQQSFKFRELNKDIQSTKHIQLFACKDPTSKRDKIAHRGCHPINKMRTLSQKLREVPPAFGMAQRRLNYPNPFIRDLTRRQQELQHFSHSSTKEAIPGSLSASLDEPFRMNSDMFQVQSVDYSKPPPLTNASCHYEPDASYAKSQTLSPSFGSDLLDRFTRPSLNQLFTRIANKNSIRIEAQSKLTLCLSKFGL